MAKNPRVPVENQITTLSVVKIAIKFSPCKVNAPVCEPLSVCGHFFIFSAIDEANDKKLYDNHYKHYPE